MAFTIFVKLAPDTIGDDQYLVQFQALTLESAKRLATSLESGGDTILALTETVQGGPYHNCERVIPTNVYACDECGENKEHPDNLVRAWYNTDALTYTGTLLCHECLQDAGPEYIDATDDERWAYGKEVVS